MQLMTLTIDVRAVTYSPNDIRGAYNVASVLSWGYTGEGVIVAVVNKGIDNTFYTDVQTFSSLYGLPTPSISAVRPYGTTGTDQELPDGETTGDVEFVHAMAPDAQILLVLVGTHSLLDGFSYVIDNNAADIAVLSPSWAYWGAGAQALVQSYNTEYAKSVQKGITLIAASNDWGSNNTWPWGTVVGDFWTLHLPDSYLMPQYSPYVTAVGGTVLTVSSGAYGSETGWERSGGGPSNLFPEPTWQTGLGVPQNGYRNMPDIAMDAACETGYSYFWGGSLGSFCGTSAGAPTFAGIVADIVQAAGHRIGFLNPALYAAAASQPSIFHDVTSGCSKVVIGNPTNPPQTGYCASAGWDFVTGWGSVDAARLLTYLVTTSVTVTSTPVGSGFVTVDNLPLTTPHVFSWTVGSSHTIAAISPVSGTPGTQYLFHTWSDGGAQSHTIIVPYLPTTYNAIFNTQYYLTMQTSPLELAVSPSSGWQNAGKTVTIIANANKGYVFSSWAGTGSGSYSGLSQSATLTVNGLMTETANYNKLVGIPLVAGWNLVSLPLVPKDTAITSVLSWQISANNVVVVYSYTKTGWRNYVIGKGGTLTTMTDGNGYWIYMKADDILYVDGNVIPPASAPPTYSLLPGWNLVGFKPQPTIQNITVHDYLQSISGSYDVNNVWIYDNTNGNWIRASQGGSTWLKPGQAMWVLMTAPAALRP